MMSAIDTASDTELNVASQSFVDFVGVSLAALSTDRLPLLLENISTTSPGANKLPNGMSASCEKAAFGWGTAAHFLDFDDLSVALIGHPSAVLYGAILPVAYELDSTGAEVIAAYLAGYEKLVEVSKLSAQAQYNRGWHTTSSIGVLGATAAVCRLKEFGPDKTAHALGIAASFAAGIRINFGSEVKPIHAGWTAGAAIQACQLAAIDVTPSQNVFNSPISYFNVYAGAQSELPAVRSSVDSDLAVKAHAACGFAARPIDAALEVRGASADLWQSIETINCSISPLANDVLQFKSPVSGAEAKFSLEYCLAYAMVHGAVPLGAFEGSRLHVSDDVRRVMDRIERVIDFNIDSGLENEKAELDITFASGETARSVVRIPKGYPGNRLQDRDLKDKFRDCAQGVLSGSAIDELFDRCMSIVSQPSVRDFIDDLTTR